MNLRSLLISFALGLICLPAAADTLEIREWLVPWEDSRPRDPFVDARGYVWFVGQRGHYVANMHPETGQFNRYDLELGTGPHNLIVDDSRNVWYAGNLAKHIGLLETGTGKITKIEMPNRRARDPHTLVFDSKGNIWFTVQNGNFVGNLNVASHDVELIEVPTKKSRPYGIVIDSKDVPWVVEFGSYKLLRIDPERMSVQEIELPNKKSRPRRLVITSDDNIWYCDYALGLLGKYDPATGKISEWKMPSGEDSKPYGMAVDKFDRIWLVETGVTPNRFVGFDTSSGEFLSETDIPSGAGSVRHMNYFEPAGEVWFGTDTNYIGRANVH